MRCRRPRAAPARRSMRRAVGEQRQLVELLLGGQQIALDPIGDELARRPASSVNASGSRRAPRARPAAPPSRPANGTQTPCFSKAAPRAPRPPCLSSLSVMTRHSTSGGGCCASASSSARALVGLAARHAQFEQAALGEQRQRLRRVAQLVPIEAALDEEHRAIGVAGGARRGPDRIRRLADQQRLIARHQIGAGSSRALERGGQLIEHSDATSAPRSRVRSLRARAAVFARHARRPAPPPLRPRGCR